MTETERELIERIRNGDVEALAEYVELKRSPLLGFVERQLSPSLRSKVEAEDLLQEISAEAVRTLPAADLAERDPFGWLCQLAQRRAIDAHRHFFGAQKRNAHREVSGAAPDAGSSRNDLMNQIVMTMTTPSQAFSRDQRYLRLNAALAELPQEHREAIRMRYVEGLASKEIAERLGKTDGAVRVMLSRSLSRLERLLAEES